MQLRTAYNSRDNSPLRYIDWFTVVLYAILVIGGVVSIYAASYQFDNAGIFEFSMFSGKQMMWIGISVVIGFCILLLDRRIYDAYAYPVYVAIILLLILTIFIAPNVKGSHSWIVMGPISIQPAEFGKFATALAMAKLFSGYNFTLNKSYANYLKAALIIVLPIILIICQRETGSALVYFSFFLMLYREGMPGCFLFTGVAAVTYFVVGIRYADLPLPYTETGVGEFVVLLLIWIFTIGMLRVYLPRTRHALRLFLWGFVLQGGAWLFSRFIAPFDIAWVQVTLCLLIVGYLIWHFVDTRVGKYFYIAMFALGSMVFLYSSDYALNRVLQPHQQTRVKVLLGVEEDAAGAGYNVNQSKIAIGSGGLEGKGFMNGTQTKLKYVPEQDTDFIFCTVGEEEGFIGSAAVLLLFLSLLLRLIYLSERQSTVFSRVYGYCVLSIIFFHVLINVGMVMGLMPVIGIPLPFFSYGGSSLWGFTLLLFIFLRMDVGNTIRRETR